MVLMSARMSGPKHVALEYVHLSNPSKRRDSLIKAIDRELNIQARNGLN